MNVIERCYGVPLTPELRALVRTVIERKLHRIEGRIVEVRVRLVSVPEGIECHTVLRPRTGAAIAAGETRPTVLDALLASANDAARELERRHLARGRRYRRRRWSRGRWGGSVT
jgi:hypothetical protein